MENAKLISSIRTAVERGKLVTTVWMMNGDQYVLENFRYKSFNGERVPKRPYAEFAKGVDNAAYDMMAAYLVDNLSACAINFNRDKKGTLYSIYLYVHDMRGNELRCTVKGDANVVKERVMNDVYSACVRAGKEIDCTINTDEYSIYAMSVNGYGILPLLLMCKGLF